MPDEDEIAILRELAKHARQVAGQIDDQQAVAGLLRYAEAQEARARELESATVLPPAAAIPSGEPPIAHAGAALKPELPDAAPDEPEKPK